MLRETIQKMKITTFILFVVSVVVMPVTAVRAEASEAVTIDEIVYLLDLEEQTAQVHVYQKDDDPTCTEIVIQSRISYGQKEYTVTSIDARAFAGAKYIKSIEIPATITEIGENAFGSCSALTGITLPNGIKSIENTMFSGCKSLEEIEIPNMVESIGVAAFLGCSKLKKIVIPNGVTMLGDNCFQECSSLEEVVLPDNITTLPYASFVLCKNLKKITLPSNLTQIDSSVFSSCEALEEITLPNGLKFIGRSAFSGCDTLTEMVIPESVEEVDVNVVYGCENLKRIFYPSHLKDAFVSAEYNDLAKFSYIINPDGTVSIKVEHLPEGMTEISLPRDIGGRQIVSITGPQGVNLPVSCTKHYTKTYTKSADSHQYTCAVCKKPVKEAHSYPSGSKPCVCGYVPFAIAVQPTGLQLAYAHKDAVLSVTAKATFGTENITYQWLENGTAIVGATSSTYKIPQKSPVGSHTYTCKLTSGGYSQVTKAAIVTVKPPVKGKKYKDDANMATYKVTKARVDGQGTAEYVKPVSKKKATVIIPATVEIGGVTYKVTAIAKNAFKGNKNLKRVTIEKNVGKIGANAFSGCKKLKNITIKTTKLKTKKVGANAFKNIKSNATIKVPKKKVKAYKSMLKKKGVSTKAKIRKM